MEELGLGVEGAEDIVIDTNDASQTSLMRRRDEFSDFSEKQSSAEAEVNVDPKYLQYLTEDIEPSAIETIPHDVDYTAMYFESFDPLEITNVADSSADYFSDPSLMSQYDYTEEHFGNMQFDLDQMFRPKQDDS